MSEQKLLKLMLTRVDGPVFEGEAVSITLPGADGEMTILANHEALISPLKKGTVTIRKADGTEETHKIDSGTLEISNNQATVLI